MCANTKRVGDIVKHQNTFFGLRMFSYPSPPTILIFIALLATMDTYPRSRLGTVPSLLIGRDILLSHWLIILLWRNSAF